MYLLIIHKVSNRVNLANPGEARPLVARARAPACPSVATPLLGGYLPGIHSPLYVYRITRI